MNLYSTNSFNRKKFLLMKMFLLVISLLIAVSPCCVFANESGSSQSNATLLVNGKTLSLDTPPLIISSRLMIPARALFEEVGGDVNWDNKSKTVTIKYSSHEIKLTINSSKAIVDGNTKNMDVPAQIINSRTLIPLRFVAESLNFKVNWDASTKTATVDVPNNTPTETVKPVETLNQIKNVSVTHGGTSDMYTSVKIEFSQPLTESNYSRNLIANPDRYYIDFFNSSISNSYSKSLYSTTDGHSSVKSIRANMYTETTYRLVFDLNAVTTPSVTLSKNNTVMTILFTRNLQYVESKPITVSDPGLSAETDNPSPNQSYSDNYNPYNDGKLIVALDPGHGKSTGGKRSPDGTLMEYEFNRDVANRIKTILEKNGIQVVMTVEDDTDVSLANRCNIANNSNCDIYVSIHANAFGNGVTWENKATGWEIYYYDTSTIGKKLANYIHDANIPGIGIKDRGVKYAGFYVIKNSEMPAVLIEHGFFTSETEVKLLKSSSWRQTAAELDAKGIMNFLYSYK